MADEKKTYLVNVESNLDKYAKEAAEAKKQVDALTESNKLLKTSGEASAAEIEASNAALRNAQKEYTQAKKMVDLQTAANNSNANSRKQLSAIVELEQKRLGALANQYVINDKGQRVLSQDYIETVKRLKDAKDAIILYDKAQSDGRSSIGLYSEAIQGAIGKLSGLPGPIGAAATGIKSFATVLKTAFISNPIGIVIAAIVGAIAGLISIFKKFDPIVEKFQQIMGGIKAVFRGLKEGIIGLITGQKTLGESFEGLGKSIKKAYDEGVKLKRLEQELEDIKALEVVSNAKAKRQIDELLLASRNRTKSEEERQILIGQALLLEEVQYNDRKKIADAEVEIQKRKITNGKNFTDVELKELDRRGIAYLLELQKRKSISDEEVKAYADSLANQENVLDESISIREKAMNRADLLEQQAEAKRIKRDETAKKKIDDLRKQDADWNKEQDAFIKDTLAEWDKQATDKWNAEVELQRKIFEQNRKAGQAEYDARIAQEKALAEAVIQIHEETANATMDLANSVTNFLAGIAGQNKALQNASLIADRAFAIAQIIINTTKANSTIRAMAAASVLPGPAYLARLALAQARAMIPININRVAAALDIAAIVASTITGLAKSSGGGGSGGGGNEPNTITSTPAAHTAFATPVGSSFINQPQLLQGQLNAIPNQNMLTAKDIAYELSKLPPPIVTVEDINAKTQSVKKVEVRANI
jgi:hypothetical protein